MSRIVWPNEGCTKGRDDAHQNLQQATANIDILQTENLELYTYIEDIGQDFSFTQQG